MTSDSFQRLFTVARKEFIHVLRDPATLFFALMIPVTEILLLGFAIDTNVRNIRAVVFDQARTQESRALIRSFANTGDVRIVGEAFSDEELSRGIVAGRSRIGIKIPEDYSRLLLSGRTAQILILVDGSESSVAAAAVNVGNAIALRESLTRVLGTQPLPIESRPRVLFNPDTRSANFFVPGLLVVLGQMMAVMMSALAIVREKEKGTLETLYMTPVRAGELVVGKMFPYLLLTFIQSIVIATMMITVFEVPIHGRFVTLLLIELPFVLAMLGMGLLISANAGTREEAMQKAMGTVVPSIFLSGYVFPFDSMPPFFWYAAQLIPTTWMIDAARGVILRGADWPELRLHALVLWALAGLFTIAGTLRFRKRSL